MGIRSAFNPMGEYRPPFKKNQVLLDIRHSNPDTVALDEKGFIKLHHSRYLLELVSAGCAGGGWQDGAVWSGGGSGAAVKLELELPTGRYEYCCPGATNGSGLWVYGGSGRDAFFKCLDKEDEVNFHLTGANGYFGMTTSPGGLVITCTPQHIINEYLKANGFTASGRTNRPGANLDGAASVYITENIEWGKGANSMGSRGLQGFLRLTYLGN